ncbi:carboxylating nicotinate-nucleotide diphosphorylase [Janibacter alkaliphilus]|uniref:Nicotinate-nucleotide pyrophosphorylase [carboxylating] n=1 Tax=Janibacter alkaliphilus TaxID=1069963 RepID=A0A852X3T4_9MICO|nr:carboxylating nicotinate-nucleotide diphosphorylase [Janibacter alkaliphilus]NYG37549.1 nicotinate-nucleotide pyrophosphorylase (carboxylating) [Janibacter alkaliphilus]
MSLDPLPDVITGPVIRAALAEDLGRAGDLTTDAVVPADQRATVAVTAREPGVVAGSDLLAPTFAALDPAARVDLARADGGRIGAGEVIATVSGPARALLTGERVALNLLGHLSGVATATAALVEAVAGTGTSVCCTRKTTPGLRALEKHAVRAGGGVNHRFGLDDAVLVKDNHLAVAGSVTEAVRRVRARVGHLVSVEVEVDTLDQLAELLADPVDAVLLDNMDPGTLAEAVRMVDRRMVTEASGRVTAETAGALAASGVDLISVGWITHSAPVLDVGLDSVPER